MNRCLQFFQKNFFSTLKSPFYSKKNKPINPKGNQPWIFIGRTGAEAEAPILWPPDAKSQLIGKEPDAGKECGDEEKGATDDEMVGWLHWLNGHEFEQVPGDSEGQGHLMCCSSWDHQGLDYRDWTATANVTEDSFILSWSFRSLFLFLFFFFIFF